MLCLLVASLTYIIGQMTGVGVAFSRFLGVSNHVGIYVGMGIVFLYAVFGGMKGITYTQVAQYVVLILAYTIPAIFISLQLTGNPIPQLGLGSSIVGQDVSLLSKLDQVVTELGFGKYTTTTAGSTLNMFVLHPVADDRHRRPAARDHALLYRAERARRAQFRRLGAGVHRHPVHHGACRGRDGEDEPDPHYHAGRGHERYRCVRQGRSDRVRKTSRLDEALGEDRPAEVRGQER